MAGTVIRVSVEAANLGVCTAAILASGLPLSFGRALVFYPYGGGCHRG